MTISSQNPAARLNREQTRQQALLPGQQEITGQQLFSGMTTAFALRAPGDSCLSVSYSLVAGSFPVPDPGQLTNRD